MKASLKPKFLNLFKYTMASLVLGSLYMSAQAGSDFGSDEIIVVPTEVVIAPKAQEVIEVKDEKADEGTLNPIALGGDNDGTTIEKKVIVEPSKIPTGNQVIVEPSKIPTGKQVQKSQSFTLGSVDKDFRYFSSKQSGLSKEKQYSCLERYRRYAGNKAFFNNKYKRVYNMFWNNSSDQNDLIEIGAEKRGFNEDNVREIIEVGFKRGDFCPVGGKLFTDNDVERYVLSFSKKELEEKEVRLHDQRITSCKDEYIWEHVRDRATKKGLRRGAAVAAIYGGLSGNGPLFVAALGTGLFSIFHKSKASRATVNYGLMTDESLNAESKEFVKIFREISKMKGGVLSANPKDVEALIASTLEEGFQGRFCSGKKLMSSKDIRKYTIAKIQEKLSNASTDVAKVPSLKIDNSNRTVDSSLKETESEERAIPYTEATDT